MVPVAALQTGMLVGVDALNSKYCLDGCLTVEGTVGRDSMGGESD